jgi:hypothetical protein
MTSLYCPDPEKSSGNQTLKSRFRRLALSLCGALLLLPVTAMAQTNDWPAIEAAARKEGKVMLYQNLNPAGAERLANEFRKAYPAIKM